MEVNPNTVIISDAVWTWTKATVATEAHKHANFFDKPTNISKMYTTVQEDVVTKIETPMLFFIPAGMVEWLPSARRTPWELYRKIKKR